MRKLVTSVIAGAMLAVSALGGSVFADPPADQNCHGVTISGRAEGHGGIGHAADDLGISVKDLQETVRQGCP
jgi:hypothetical protein